MTVSKTCAPIWRSIFQKIYRYLQTIRLDKAKKFLEQGIPPVEATAMAGFSDQSHFTNFFKEFIGLTPRQYQKIFLSEPDKEQ